MAAGSERVRSAALPTVADCPLRLRRVLLGNGGGFGDRRRHHRLVELSPIRSPHWVGNGDRAHDSRHARGRTCDRLSSFNLQARTHQAVQVYHMIQRLHGDCVWLQVRTLMELRHYIRSDIRIPGASVEAAFLVCVVERTSGKSAGQDKGGRQRTKWSAHAPEVCNRIDLHWQPDFKPSAPGSRSAGCGRVYRSRRRWRCTARE